MDPKPDAGISFWLPKNKVFSKKCGRSQVQRPDKETQKIHCIRRQRHKPRETMKKCAAYGTWFHIKCLQISKQALASYEWTCEHCQ